MAEIRKVGKEKREEFEVDDAEKIEGDKMSQSGPSGVFGKISNKIPPPPIKSDENGAGDDDNDWE